MPSPKKLWVKRDELNRVRDLLRERFLGRETERIRIPEGEILPLLRKPVGSRLVWTRGFRRFFAEELGVRCSHRAKKGEYLFSIADREKWRESLEGAVGAEEPQISQLTPQQFSPTEDPLIPAPDPEYHLPKCSQDLVTSIRAGERVLLVGPTGCGKSSLVRELAARERARFLRINLNGETAVPDIVGQFKIDAEKQMVFQEGPIPRAMRLGCWLLVDELDSALPAVLFALHALLEDGGHLHIAETGETIVPHSDFRIVASANTLGRGDETGLYAGTNVLNEALLDRFHAVFHADYLPPEQEKRLLATKVPSLSKETGDRMIKAAGDIRRAIEDGTIYTSFSTRRLLAWGRKAVQLGDLKRATLYTVLNRLSEDDRRVVREVLQRHGL